VAASIEVIVGSMFSGKTEELIRRLRRAKYAKQSVQVFKPRIDNRYSETHVASHDQNMFESHVIDGAREIETYIHRDTRVIGIDEGQFFGADLVDVVTRLANRGVRVIVAGLDQDWRGEPFYPMPSLMAIAEKVDKLQAVCVVCGEAASRTQRLVKSAAHVLVGDHDAYEARCRSCFDISLAMESQDQIEVALSRAFSESYAEEREAEA
jgi:thymidine kinase